MLFTTLGAFAAAALSSANLAAAADITVTVGPGLSYSPNTVTAAAGDSVTFKFAGSHTATQSTFNSPCTQSGFTSGPMNSGGTFSVPVNDTNPIWVYCGVPGHCQAGMVMAINAPTSGTNTFQNFQAKAEGKSVSTDSGSSTSSGASSTSGGATTTSGASSGSSTSAAPTTTTSSGAGFLRAGSSPAWLSVTALGTVAAMVLGAVSA